ncbi:MAG TPA: right-handed parallel beta-helix repeat-containing protein [Acidimicrobiales bacterium]|jgi:hypothetical protein|nr:right-handed parallel beta-helix repeat-containing protein [Acidimicrobiales bacterium]
MQARGNSVRSLRSWARRVGVAVAALTLATGGLVVTSVVMAPAATALAICTPAGTTALTADIIATTGQSITGTVDATGCDIGIYVPPGTSGVTIDGATVSGANDHGIMAENTTGLTIQNSTIENNGLNPTHNIDTNKAVLLVGVTNSSVENNTVTGNLADGGISVTDEGNGVNPGAPGPGPLTPIASTNDGITGNTVNGNFGGCGIIVESWVAGAGTNDIFVTGNQVLGDPGVFGPHGPVIGQIVVATDAPGATVTNTEVSGNTVNGSFISGITVHSNAPGDSITGTTIHGNSLDNNNWGHINGAPQTDAIALIVNNIPGPSAPVLSGTAVTDNTMTNQFAGVWQTWQVTGTTLSGNTFSGPPNARLFYTQPAPGLGYWMTASDGGVFTFGQASFWGSLGGQSLNAPVVGLAQTRDQGGYVLAGADGSVSSFGDAITYGSVGAGQLTAPIVGVAMTPSSQSGTQGLGYWLVGSDGNVYPFGHDAASFGSTVGTPLNQPIVGMAPTPDGAGYWLVAADGGVFSFGDAGFFGSEGGKPLNAPVSGIVPTADGQGYWLVAKDGGVFTFGDAGFFGSMGGKPLNAPVVGILSSGGGQGYSLVAADGGVFTFGDAGFFGSMGGQPLNAPVVGGAAEGLNA